MIELVVNNGDTLPPSAPGVVVPFTKPAKKSSKPRKKRLTQKELFVRDVSEMGEISDHLFAACQNMDNAERKAFRAYFGPILEAMRQLRQETAEYVVEEEGADD